MRLENKVALITGGSRGQGAAEARLFAGEGCKVVIADVLEDEGRQLEAEINETGGECVFVRLDVTSEEEWKAAVSTAVDRFGKLDILVNNAGIYRQVGIEETTEELWDNIFDINAKGVFLGTKTAIPEMRKAGGGSIINISSVAGLIGSWRAPAYGATKGAVRLFTKSTAIQYAGEGTPLQLGAPRHHRNADDHANTAAGRKRAPGIVESHAHWQNRPSRRCSLRRPVPGVRRIVVYDRERAGHRRRPLRPVGRKYSLP